MHKLTNNLDESYLYLYSFILSIIVFFRIYIPFLLLLKQLFDFELPIWIETPSILGIFYLGIYVYSNYLWKIKYVKYLRLPLIPNLNGVWDAVLISSYNQKIIKAKVKIIHSYSTFTMILETDESTSNTNIAYFDLEDPHNMTITYNFLSKPKGNAAQTMNIHEGTATLIIDEKQTALQGTYYTGRGRQTYGDINLTRSPSK